MKFLCHMAVAFPEGMKREEVESYQKREREYSQALQRSGEFEQIYRVLGKYENISIFEVDSTERLHEILSGFPMYAHMSIETTALVRHPNALES